MNNGNLESETIQFSHNFKYSLERVWIFLNNISIISLISEDSHYHPIFEIGNEFKLGSKFIGILFGKFPYKGTVNKIKEFPGYKKIKWIFNFENGGFLSFKIELFKVTEDNTSISLFTFKVNIKLKEQLLSSKENLNLVLQRIDKILEESTVDLIQYESGVISGSMEDIWDFIANISKLKMIAPLIKFDGNENFKDSNCGDNLTFNLENQSKKIYSKILVKNKNEKWNKWICVVQIMKGEPKIPIQKLIVELTKINQSDCQLILLTKFDESINNDYIQSISEEKKYIINSIKDYLENYKN